MVIKVERKCKKVLPLPNGIRWPLSVRRKRYKKSAPRTNQNRTILLTRTVMSKVIKYFPICFDKTNNYWLNTRDGMHDEYQIEERWKDPSRLCFNRTDEHNPKRIGRACNQLRCENHICKDFTVQNDKVTY